MSDLSDESQLLERFRAWLDQARGEANIALDEGSLEDDSFATDGDPTAADIPSVGLYQLAAEFTALRQELKLQTKSSRGLQEQAESALNAMQHATEQLRAAEARAADAGSGEAAAKPVVEGLINLHDALERGRAVIESGRTRVVEDSARELQKTLHEQFRRQRWWRRWIVRPYFLEVQELLRKQADEVQANLFDSILEGYGLIQKRLARAMAESQLEQVACGERTVDPHSMTVLEAIRNSGKPPGMVIQEVRRGYRWRGRVVRFAEVTAAAAIDSLPGEQELRSDVFEILH